MKECNSQTLRDAAFAYNSMGYKILSLHPKTKKAECSGWSNPLYMDSPVHWDSHPENNIGMPLARNHMFVLDIDNKPEYTKSVKAIENQLVELTGVDSMFWESDTIGISSGKEGSEKYMFKVPEGFESCMKYKRINWGNKDNEYHSVVEFRCGDGFQDVMPPSIHPGGTKYQFVNGDELLVMPPDLLCLVCNWGAFIGDLMEVNPDYVKPVVIRNKSGKPYEGEDYAQIWDNKENVNDWLRKYNYTPAGNNRYLSPSSTSGSAGIVVFDGGKKFWSFGSSDYFCDGYPHGSYDLLRHYEFKDSYKEAWKYIIHDLGVNRLRSISRTPRWS